MVGIREDKTEKETCKIFLQGKVIEVPTEGTSFRLYSCSSPKVVFLRLNEEISQP